ncbi:hypothetical protein MWN33_02220 [Starkeya koreensis]|uniref:Terminase small subunit n=1 Tax=Ancylobacter koreensis TaxID=266121 RepID=A0ABT0DHV4_9HYPH|nr:hypothetical protein [Ancylobacter koreensis]MCK0206842.1 hypothetical protein [Ancylobacter koreensis]
MKTVVPEAASADEISNLLGCTARRARQIAAEANIRPAGRGAFPVALVVQAALAAARRERGGSDESRARAEFAKTRTAEIAQRRAERARELIPVEDAIAAVEHVVAVAVSELVGLPARLSRDRAERRRIDDECRGVRSRIAKRLAAETVRLKTGDSDEQ